MAGAGRSQDRGVGRWVFICRVTRAKEGVISCGSPVVKDCGNFEMAIAHVAGLRMSELRTGWRPQTRARNGAIHTLPAHQSSCPIRAPGQRLKISSAVQ